MSQNSVPDDVIEVIEAIGRRLSRNQRLRRNLPGKGRIRIDRQLPFLCVYRAPADRKDVGTREMVTSEAAYLFISGEDKYCEHVVDLCEAVSKTVQEHFGVFLMLELWAGEHVAGAAAPGFRIVTPETDTLPTTIEAFETALEEIQVQGQAADVELVHSEHVAPPSMPPLTTANPENGGGCFHIGIEIRPIYRDAQQTLYPMIAQSLRTQLSRALRKAIFAFTRSDEDETEGHYESLGPTALVNAVDQVDRQLCEVSDSFDFLLQVTPTNSEQAWVEFRDNRYEIVPLLHYRPLPYRPSLLKRRLFDAPIERIEDTTLAQICWEKQQELDRQITALSDLNSPKFLWTSRQLYADADDELVELANEILRKVHNDPVEEGAECVDAKEIAARAKAHLNRYRWRLDEFDAKIEVCDHIAAGLMVAKDRLYISENARLRSDRLEALLHHEIGTHLLTYFNGRQQPFRQLYAGLAGYESLQEGLAVLAEYFVGGLTAGRLRTLAGRVLAVRALCEGATFVETFRRLHREIDFAPHTAFRTTLRVFRGGGLTKDAIYLRGLRDLLAYLRQGHDVDPLYVGKIALHHVPYIQELRRRGIIQPPALMPSFWDDEAQPQRLKRCRQLSIPNLVRNER